MPRYVILRHDLPPESDRGAHWDLMFEQVDVLRTWALEGDLSGAVELEATQLPDHRTAYLEYEGPVSGNRGTVVRWDRGEYRLQTDTPDRWEADLSGGRMTGRVVLARLVTNGTLWRYSFSCEGSSP